MAERRAAEQATGGEGPAAPDALWARPRRKIGVKLLIGVAVLVLIARVGAARRPPAPVLAASCTTPSFALSAYTVKQARPLVYTIVGPEDRRYVLGLDTLTFVRQDDGGWNAVPAPGDEDSYLIPAGVAPMKHCRRTGLFSLPVPVGEHVLTLYELKGTQAPEIQRVTVTVTADDPR